MSIGSGVQIIHASDDDKVDLQDRITYAPTFTIGKYFSPIWGLKLNFTGGTLHGYNDGVAGIYRKWNSGSKHYMGEGYAGIEGYPDEKNTSFLTWDPKWNRMGFALDHEDYDKLIIYDKESNEYYWAPGMFNDRRYRQNIKYFAGSLHFMFDFLTLVGNYNPRRPFEISPYGGVTYAHLFPSDGQESYNTVGASGGLNFRFRLSEKFDFYIDAAAYFYPDEFDGHMGGSHSIDPVLQGTGGFTYKIGKSSWDVADPMNYDMIEDLNRKINDLRSQLEASAAPCPDCPPCPEPKDELVSNDIKFLPEPVFFRINKSDIDASEWSKIQIAVDYLHNYPDANIVITGYADRKTGTPAYNLRLSERRAKEVSKAMIERYGVSPLRISINWEGDRIQPFEVNEWNRVVVFVIED